MYATYGDKHSLFLQSLSAYSNEVVGYFTSRLDDAERPLDEIASLFHDVAVMAGSERGRAGCLITNSAAELGGDDQQASQIINRTFDALEEAYRRALVRAQDNGELDPGKEPRALARFLVATMQGLRLMGKTRPEPGVLDDVVESVMQCLR
jgi:TetR/AcrR family transcriptional repressor of nem operon